MITVKTPYVPSLVGITIVVYQQKLNESSLYVGVCKLNELFNSPDARQNSEWKRIVTPGAVLETEVLYTTTNIIEARDKHREYVQHLRPWCNLNGKSTDGIARIRCVQTGEEYASAAEACKQHLIAPGTMSNHLNGRKGYNTIHKLTFERIG